jgi:uncharacterized protein YfiM (DUF2279 family)
MGDKNFHRPRPGLRRWAIAASTLSLLFSLLILDIDPKTEFARKPTAPDVAAARQLISQLRESQDTQEPVYITLDEHQLAALAKLAGETAGIQRVEAKVSNGIFKAGLSAPVLKTFWLNATVRAEGSYNGFPAVSIRMGRIVLPDRSSRLLAKLSRHLLMFKGIEVPPIDLLVRTASVNRDSISAQISLPRHSGLFDRLTELASSEVDKDLTASIYCDLASSQTLAPEVSLAPLVQAAFHDRGNSDPVIYNRAAFLAVAFYTVGDQAYRLAPDAARLSARCSGHARVVTLRGRTDLAKHWALSAALTAVLGERTAANLGEWKELHDSLPAGSGFSFVDLAADRSGVHLARRAIQKYQANAVANELANVTNDRLLPISLLSVPEGLSEADFVGQYAALDGRKYIEAVKYIDEQLSLGS